MGWVKKRKGLDGETQFMAVYRDLNGNERSAGTYSTEKRAIREWHKAEELVLSGKAADPGLGKQTLRHYVETTWLANHVIELSTRENYVYALNRYVLPELGNEKLGTLMPQRIREWVTVLQSPKFKAKPPTIQKAKVVLDAILTTAFHDGITQMHAGRHVKIPPVASKPRRIVTAEQYASIQEALKDDLMRLLVETDIESGMRWGELTELRPKDLNLRTGVLTISRAVIELKARDRPEGVRFVVKPYPKDKEWRQIKLAAHTVTKLGEHIRERGLGRDDLIFGLTNPITSKRRTLPEELPDPETLGLTEPNEHGRRYRHGTPTAYGLGKCRCQRCRDAVASYRADRRQKGKDQPHRPRPVDTDGHIPNSWFRRNVWNKALDEADIGFRVTPHDLRHAHASWLLAGGADIQVVMERLGHGSMTTTAKYLHTLPNAHEAALQALDAIRGTSATVANSMLASGGSATTPDARDAELAELRRMVAKFRDILGPLSDTA